MSMLSLVPALMVEDVPRAVAFYRDVLGFALVEERSAGAASAGPPTYVRVRSGGASLAFATRGHLAAFAPRLANLKLGGTLVLELGCDDLDALCERIGERAPLLKAPHATAKGRQCAIQDPDGYVLTFTEHAAPAATTPETIP